MRVEWQHEIQKPLPPPKKLVVIALTDDEARHLKRIINGAQAGQLSMWTQAVKSDLWGRLTDLDIGMASL